MQQKNYGDASVEFRNAIRIDPRFAEAYYQLAQAELAQRDWRAAFVALERTLELDPSRSDARLERGRLYLAGRQFDKAEQDAKTILRADPNNAAAYGRTGWRTSRAAKARPSTRSIFKGGAVIAKRCELLS